MIAPLVPRLVGPRVTLRRGVPADEAGLHAILAEPAVAECWPGYSAERVRAELIGQPERTRIIAVGEATAGALLLLRGSDPERPTTGVRLFLGASWRGRQLGAEALALAIRHEFASGATRITLDPTPENAAAIHCAQRLGFRSVGLLREYWLAPDGHPRDALLLELVRGDFPPRRGRNGGGRAHR